MTNLEMYNLRKKQLNTLLNTEQTEFTRKELKPLGIGISFVYDLETSREEFFTVKVKNEWAENGVEEVEAVRYYYDKPTLIRKCKKDMKHYKNEMRKMIQRREIKIANLQDEINELQKVVASAN